MPKSRLTGSSTVYHLDVTSLPDSFSAPYDVPKPGVSETRYNAQEVYECRVATEIDIVQQRYKEYRIDLYATTETWSWLDTLGVVLIVVGVIALGVVTAGTGPAAIAAGTAVYSGIQAGSNWNISWCIYCWWWCINCHKCKY